MTTPIARSLPPLKRGSLLSPRLYAHLVLEWPLASGSSCIGKDAAARSAFASAARPPCDPVHWVAVPRDPRACCLFCGQQSLGGGHCPIYESTPPAAGPVAVQVAAIVVSMDLALLYYCPEHHDGKVPGRPLTHNGRVLRVTSQARLYTGKAGAYLSARAVRACGHPRDQRYQRWPQVSS